MYKRQPILSVATQQRTVTTDSITKSSSEVWTAGLPLHLVPDDVQITTDVAVELRSKGIYSLPVYVSKIVITGAFKSDALAGLLVSDVDTRVLPAQAILQLPVSGIKFLRGLARFDVAGQELHPSSGDFTGFPALSVPIDLRSVERSGGLPFPHGI